MCVQNHIPDPLIYMTRRQVCATDGRKTLIITCAGSTLKIAENWVFWLLNVALVYITRVFKTVAVGIPTPSSAILDRVVRSD
jgi:hypothetical protein